LYSSRVPRAPFSRLLFAGAAAWLLVSSASAAQAQPPTPGASAPPSALLPRADFSFEWEGLIAHDVRFDWRGAVLFDIDVADFGRGRLTFATGYEAILGRERRRYDLNQGTYWFDVTASRQVGETEVGAVLSHSSRHVVDRDNVPSISWNTAGVRIARGFPVGRASVDAQLDVGHAMQQAFVDYTWMSSLRLGLRAPISSRVAVVTAASGSVVGVNHLVRAERVCGGRIDGGLRLDGRAAALEVFAGYERRIDAYPTDRFRVRWVTLGFRLVSR
jgi:hypothetical protein